MKPIIGIVSKHTTKNGMRPDMAIRDELKQAIFDNGAIAIGILLPKDEVTNVGNKWSDNFTKDEYENLIAQIHLCDGIIFQGGMACDNYEMIAAKYCYEQDIPTLGICCGQNVLARALGGVTTPVANPEVHYQYMTDYVHEITINPNSLFYDIVHVDKMLVNSRHKKTIKDCPLLDKVAFCSDGYPDVIEAKNKKFYLGVRFHPESLYKTDQNMNQIFHYFIETCKK